MSCCHHRSFRAIQYTSLTVPRAVQKIIPSIKVGSIQPRNAPASPPRSFHASARTLPIDCTVTFARNLHDRSSLPLMKHPNFMHRSRRSRDIHYRCIPRISRSSSRGSPTRFHRIVLPVKSVRRARSAHHLSFITIPTRDPSL
jgi:hypothetical protein